MAMNPAKYPPEITLHRLARKALVGFLITFVLLRILVYSIMAGKIPFSYVFIDGTHLHHFNEGIFMLALVAGITIFCTPTGRALEFIALLYGIAIALTFDEFGMWFHLNVTYWQRISGDMLFIIATLLGLLAYSPPWRQLCVKKALLLVLILVIYIVAARAAGQHLRAEYSAKLQNLQLQKS